MFLGYAKNHTGDTYRMLNLCKKRVVLIPYFTRINKIYGDYVSIKGNKKAVTYVLQDEYESNKWANVKIDLINTENFNTKQYHRAEKDAPKTNYNISLTKK